MGDPDGKQAAFVPTARSSSVPSLQRTLIQGLHPRISCSGKRLGTRGEERGSVACGRCECWGLPTLTLAAHRVKASDWWPGPCRVQGRTSIFPGEKKDLLRSGCVKSLIVTATADWVFFYLLWFLHTRCVPLGFLPREGDCR